MGLARRALLWVSQNQWIERQFRRRAMAQKAVSRFMPGEDVGAALTAAKAARSDGILTVITLLGENVPSMTAAEQVTRHYLDALDAIDRQDLPTQVSVKLTQFGLGLDREAAFHHLTTLLSRAADHGNFVWIDMESSAERDVTLSVFEQARAAHENVGLCLQSYLRSTADDLERLLPLRPAIRLVKGAYREPATVAFSRKRDVDASFLSLALRLLEARVSGAAGLPAFATHDVPLLQRVLDAAAEHGMDRRALEIQMLYGIGRQHQRRFARQGYAMRVLISYGTAWFPWYVRRLAERPANLWFVARSAFSR